MLDRIPINAAVAEHLRQFETNVLAKSTILDAVKVALDAADAVLAEAKPDRWVVLDRLTPVHVAESPEAARAWIKQRRAAIHKSTALRFRYVKVAGER